MRPGEWMLQPCFRKMGEDATVLPELLSAKHFDSSSLQVVTRISIGFCENLRDTQTSNDSSASRRKTATFGDIRRRSLKTPAGTAVGPRPDRARTGPQRRWLGQRNLRSQALKCQSRGNCDPEGEFLSQSVIGRVRHASVFSRRWPGVLPGPRRHPSPGRRSGPPRPLRPATPPRPGRSRSPSSRTG